jgi:hypothetical protein
MPGKGGKATSNLPLMPRKGKQIGRVEHGFFPKGVKPLGQIVNGVAIPDSPPKALQRFHQNFSHQFGERAG